MTAKPRFVWETVIAGILITAAAFLATEIWLYSRNTLAENGKWVSSKILLETSVMGGPDFMFTRVPLYRNRLDLSAWHGYNELSYANELVDPSEIQVSAEWEHAAPLSIIFNRDYRGFNGIRLSTDPKLPNIFFEADIDGKFVKKVPFEQPVLAETKHKASLTFSGTAVTVRLDNASYGTFPFVSKGKQVLGLRGGAAAVLVDRITVRDAKGGVVLDEKFWNRQHYARVFFICLGILAAAFGGIGFVLPMASLKLPATQIRFVLLSCLVGLIGVQAVYFSWDYYYWSRFYFPVLAPPPITTRLGMVGFFERNRTRLFHSNSLRFRKQTLFQITPVSDFLRDSVTRWDFVARNAAPCIFHFQPNPLPTMLYSVESVISLPQKHPGVIRAGFMGSSQTWGAGADIYEESLVSKVRHYVAPLLSQNYRFDTFDLAVPGVKSTELLDFYRRNWIGAGLDLLVINLSNNDPEVFHFEINLREIVRLSRQKHIPVVFILEANAPRFDRDGLLYRHEMMKRLAGELKLPVWDLHGFLRQEQSDDTGFLWWDHVHLTDFGQQRAAQWLAPQVAALIRQGKGPSAPLLKRDINSR